MKEETKRMDNRYAISNYPDAAAVTKQLDELIKLPIYTISPEALKRYEEDYFDKKCAKSKEMIEEAKTVIPGGVQHNLAFNHPFPLVFTKAEGAYLYDVDGNKYYDFLQAGGPTVLGSNPKVVRDQVIELLNTCGPSTGLFHEFEYKLAKKVCDSVPNVEMFRMLNSGSEACMAAVRVARLATKNKNIIKMAAPITAGAISSPTASVFPAPSSHKRTAFRFTSLNTRRSFSRTISTIWSASSVSIRCVVARRRSSLSRSAQRAVHARWIRISTRA